MTKSDPKTLIVQARQKALKTLKTSQGSTCLASSDADDIELEHLIKSVNAIIQLNKEIWERCKEHQVDVTFAGARAKQSGLVFKRVVCSKVKACAVKAYTSYNSCDSKYLLEFTTNAEVETKAFDLPDPLPYDLTRIMTPLVDENEVFPDYDSFFESCLLLHEDVMSLFLVRLKVHLESIQVYLGSIDTWLMQPSNLTDFIVENFQTELPKPRAIECGSSCKVPHNQSQRCLRCGEPSSSHGDRNRSHYDFVPHKCPGGNATGIFLENVPQSLHQCAAYGEHNETFIISEEADKKRLLKFLEYAKFASEYPPTL